MSVFNVGIFNGPKYSRFDIGHGNRVSTKPGVMKPVWWEYLNSGDRLADLDIQNIVRQAPMLAPTLDTYDVTIDAFAVRLRTLGQAERNPWVYEDFFNLNRNIDGSKALPSFPLGVFWAHNNILRTGNIMESLNVPTFKWLREIMMDFLRSHSYYTDPVCKLAFAEQYLISSNVLKVGIYPSSLPSGVLAYSAGSVSGDAPTIKLSHERVTVNGVYFANFRAIKDRYTSNFSGGSHYLCLPTLIEYVGSHYPDAIPRPSALDSFAFGTDERGGLLWQYTGSSQDILNLGLTCVGSGFVDENSLNVLENVYTYYKVDAQSVLAEYYDYVCDAFLNLYVFLNTGLWDATLVSLVESDADKSTGYYNGRSCLSLWYFVVGQVLSQMTDVPSYRGNSPADIFRVLKGADLTSYSTTLNSLGFVSSGAAAPTEKLLPTYPFNSYWKIVADWYINTAIFEPDTFYLERFIPAWNPLLQTANDWYRGGSHSSIDIDSVDTPFYRYWRNDYFTSVFPDSQLGSAVGIPVNGTIIDLRNANAMQKLKERLLYAGSRFRDVLFAITGKKTSAAIMDMSEPIGRWTMSINVDSVLQQSESTSEHPQASYAGSGLGYKLHGKKCGYTAEEPTVIMVIMSITPRASYFDGLPRKFMRGNIYDYAIPQLANVGEQDVKRVELFAGISSVPATPSSDPIFGWTRRNADFMWFPDEVHGDFRTDLDYWHNARVFGSAPRLSESFLQVRPDDDNLNRVFAVSSPVVDKFYCHVIFSGGIIRSLPKHVYYDL